MVWQPGTIARVVVPLVWLGCGGGGKPPATPQPETSTAVKPPPPPPETEEDRERKRHNDALAIVPDKSPCLPAALRNPNAPQLELAAIGSAAVVCAIDRERTRLLGPVACWSVAVSGPNPGALAYQDATPLPGRGLAVLLDGHCARGFCLPGDAKIPADGVALIAWNLENTKVAVLVGDDLHIFNAQTKAHETSFSIRGDKGVTGDPTEIDWNGEAIFVQANDGAASPVFVFKPEGVPVGPIEVLGGKDKAVLSTRNGSFLLLKPEQVAISEQALTTLTTYETATGKRAKFVRKLPAPTCKKDELDAVWRDPNAQVSAKCQDYVTRNYAPLIGADAVAGTKNLLVLLRGPRLGELAVVDSKTLAEHKAIRMPWCDETGGGGAPGAPAAAPPAASAAAGADRASSFAPAAPAAEAAPPAARKAKEAKGKSKADDPDAGGQ